MPSANQLFAAACAPGKVKILGRWLMPLTLGHVVLLSRTENAILFGGEVSFDDLVAGVQICSRNWEQGIKLINEPEPDWKLKLWQWRCRIGHWIISRDFSSLAYAPRQLILFNMWLSSQLHHKNWPAFRRKSDAMEGSGQSTSPPESLLLSALMSEFHMSFEAAMNFPYSLARTLIAIGAERSGGGECMWIDSEEHQDRKAYLMELAGVKPERN